VKTFYVNGQVLDLAPNAVIAQTLQVYDPGKLGSVTTNYTSTIRAPRTFNNDIIFGHMGNSKTKTDVPYTSLTCQYFENGLPIIRNARVVVNEVNENEYSLSVYSGPWGYFEIIQDKKLWDLDFLDINGSWSASDRDGYRTADTGIVQALVDDGRLVQDQDSTAPTIENVGSILKPPQVYLHTVFEKVFSSFGFGFEGDIFDNEIYKRIVMPLSLVYNDPRFMEAKQFFAAADGTQISTTPLTVVFNQNVKQGSDNFYDGTSDYVVENDDTSNNFFRITFYTDLVLVVTGGTVDINIEATGYTPSTLANKGSGSYTMSFLSSLGHADTDIIKVTITTSSGTPTVEVVSGTFYTVVLTGTDGFENFPSIVPGYVYFEKLFEEIGIPDFLRDMCVRFNLQITALNDKIVVNTLNTILDRRNGPDWTFKRDKGRNRIKYLFSSYGRTNSIKSTVDSERTPDLTDSYGNGTFDIPNENLRESLTIYTSFFEVSQMINTFGVFMLDMNLLPDGPNFGRMPGKRMFFVRDNYVYEPPVLYNTVDRSDYKVGFWFDPNEEVEMGWQFFIDNFHQKYIDRSLRKVRLIEREYNLSDMDIYKFDQQYPIWDDSERFLVVKISNRVTRKPCKVELLKIDPNPAVTFEGLTNEITGDLIDTMEVITDDVPPDLFIEMQLVENVTGNPTWTCEFDNTQDVQTLSVLGNFSSDSNTLGHVGEEDVATVVDKTNNDGNGPDGIPTATGWVEWLRNGVQVNTVTFDSSGPANGQGLNYTYLGVVAFEELLVIVHEDGTSP
jgi:hypothetical protein